MYDLKLSRQLNSVKSFQAISHLMHMYISYRHLTQLIALEDCTRNELVTISFWKRHLYGHWL